MIGKYRWCRVAGLLLFLTCAATTPPLPDKQVELLGQDAAGLFRDGDFVGALRCYQCARAEAARQDIPLLETRYIFNIGRLFYECNRFDSAAVYFELSSKRFSDEKAVPEAAVAGIYRALTKAYTGDLLQAKNSYMTYRRFADKNDALLLATASILLSLLEGNVAQSLQECDSAFTLLPKKEDSFSRGNLYYYKAMATFMAGNKDAAAMFLDSSLCCLQMSPLRYRNWKPLLGKAILAFCAADSASGKSCYERARKAVPQAVIFPAESLMTVCPTAW